MAVFEGDSCRKGNYTVKSHFRKSQKWLFYEVGVIERLTIQ